MAVYEQDLDRIVIRVVYDGPGRAGKTTNIEQLARLFGGDQPDLHRLAADNGHTLFFDWLSFDGGMIDGHHLLIQIVGVPGAKRFEHRRAHILRSADAVVLVCDSAPGTTDLARETLDSLREHLGKRAATTPVIVQANKQDLPGALQAHEVGAALGLPYEIPVIGAEATAGIGTRETAVHAIRSAVRLVKRRTAKPGLSVILGMAGTVAGLRAALEATSIGDPGPEDNEPADLLPVPEPVPGRKVYRPTTIDEPHLVYMHHQSGPVQAAQIRVGEPGDADPAPRTPDPDETLPSHAIIDDPDAKPTPPSRRGRRRDTETTEGRVQRGRKDRAATQTSEPRTPAARTTNPASPRKIPPRRRTAADDTPVARVRPPSGSVRIIDDTPASRSRLVPNTSDIPTPRERTTSGALVDDGHAADILAPRSHPPSSRIDADTPIARDRPPSGSVRIVDDRPPSGPVPTPGERPPSGASSIPRFRPPSTPTTAPPAPAQPIVRPPDGPLPVRNSQLPTAADDAFSSAQTLPPTDAFSSAQTLPPTDASTPPTDISASAPTLPPAGRTLLPLSPQEAASLGLPTAARPTNTPSRFEDDLSPKPANLSLGPSNLSQGPDEPPAPDVPPGHVWPVPAGRGVLKALAAAAAPRVVLESDGVRTLHHAGPFLLTADRFPDQDAALAALLARARQWQPLTPLLPKGLAFAVDSEPDGAVHLWRVALQLPPLAEHLAGLDITARMRLLEAHAHTLGQALALCRRKQLVLDLHPSAYAVEYGRVVYVRDHLAHGDALPDVGPALLALVEQLADDPSIDAHIDALARELATLVDIESTDLGLIAALEAATPVTPIAQDARTRLLSALGQPS